MPLVSFLRVGGSTLLFWLAVVYAQRKIDLGDFRILLPPLFFWGLTCLLFLRFKPYLAYFSYGVYAHDCTCAISHYHEGTTEKKMVSGILLGLVGTDS
jgi:hypothetical protein